MEAEQQRSNMIDYIRSFYKEEILFAFLSKYYKYTFSLNYFLLVLERANIYLLNLDPYKDLRMEGWSFKNAFDLTFKMVKSKVSS